MVDPPGVDLTVCKQGCARTNHLWQPHTDTVVSEEDWQTSVEFANISLRNFGGATGELTLKPLTLLYGLPESGVSHVASLVHAVVVHGSLFSVYEDWLDMLDSEDGLSRTRLELEARRVIEKRRQKAKFADSKYLADFARKRLHQLALGLEAGLLNPDSPLRRDAAGFGVALDANRARGRLEYANDGLEEFPDQPRLRINFVKHGTIGNRDKKYVEGSGPYLIRNPYHFLGPRPYESGRDVHIDSHLRVSVNTMLNVIQAARYYYSERVSQPKRSVLVSNGGLTEYVPRQENIADRMRERSLMRYVDKGPRITGDTPLEKLQSALDKAERGTMIVVENPEKHADDMESFARMLFEEANRGLYMLVATGDQTLAETVTEMRRESGGLDPEYAAVYGFEPENGGHAIVEW